MEKENLFLRNLRIDIESFYMARYKSWLKAKKGVNI